MKTLKELINDMQDTDLVISRFLPCIQNYRYSILELKNERRYENGNN